MPVQCHTVLSGSAYPTITTLLDEGMIEGDDIVYETRIGPIAVDGRWRKELEDIGVDPDAYHQQAVFFRKKYARSGDMWESSFQRLQALYPLIEREHHRHWTFFYFSTSIVLNIIERDEYGILSLYDEGCSPRTIVDVGGHVGTFCAFAATLWPEATVISIEPYDHVPDTHDAFWWLQKNTERFPNVRREPSALVGFYGDESRHDECIALLEQNVYPLVLHEQSIRETNKPHALSVAAFLTKYDLSEIDLLKIDCEGSEINILRELSELSMLSRIGHIRGEWHGEMAQCVICDLLPKTHRTFLCTNGPGCICQNFYARPYV